MNHHDIERREQHERLRADPASLVRSRHPIPPWLIPVHLLPVEPATSRIRIPGTRPQERCASCGWTAPRDYVAEAVQAISVAVETCESENDIAWARSQIHTALFWSLIKHQGKDGIRRIKYRRQTYSLDPAPQTAWYDGTVHWEIAKNGQRVSECWAPIDASQAELTRAARPFLRFIDNRTA